MNVYRIILLMVQKSGGHHPGCIKPYEIKNKLPTSTGLLDFFHQQHVLYLNKSALFFFEPLKIVKKQIWGIEISHLLLVYLLS